MDVAVGSWGAAAASQYSVSELVTELVAAATELPTALPGKMVLLGRAVVQLEGVALRADSTYRIVDDVFPSAARIALARGRGGVSTDAGLLTSTTASESEYHAAT